MPRPWNNRKTITISFESHLLLEQFLDKCQDSKPELLIKANKDDLIDILIFECLHPDGMISENKKMMTSGPFLN